MDDSLLPIHIAAEGVSIIAGYIALFAEKGSTVRVTEPVAKPVSQ